MSTLSFPTSIKLRAPSQSCCSIQDMFCSIKNNVEYQFGTEIRLPEETQTQYQGRCFTTKLAFAGALALTTIVLGACTYGAYEGENVLVPFTHHSCNDTVTINSVTGEKDFHVNSAIHCYSGCYWGAVLAVTPFALTAILAKSWSGDKNSLLLKSAQYVGGSVLLYFLLGPIVVGTGILCFLCIAGGDGKVDCSSSSSSSSGGCDVDSSCCDSQNQAGPSGYETLAPHPDYIAPVIDLFTHAMSPSINPFFGIPYHHDPFCSFYFDLTGQILNQNPIFIPDNIFERYEGSFKNLSKSGTREHQIRIEEIRLELEKEANYAWVAAQAFTPTSGYATAVSLQPPDPTVVKMLAFAMYLKSNRLMTIQHMAERLKNLYQAPISAETLQNIIHLKNDGWGVNEISRAIIKATEAKDKQGNSLESFSLDLEALVQKIIYFDKQRTIIDEEIEEKTGIPSWLVRKLPFMSQEASAQEYLQVAYAVGSKLNGLNYQELVSNLKTDLNIKINSLKICRSYYDDLLP